MFAEALQKFMVLEGVTSHIVRYVDDFLVVAGSHQQCGDDLY